MVKILEKKIKGLEPLLANRKIFILTILLGLIVFLGSKSGCKTDQESEPYDPLSEDNHRIIIDIYKYNNSIDVDLPWWQFGPPYPLSEAIIDIIHTSHKNTIGDPPDENYQSNLLLSENEMCGCSRSQLYPNYDIFLELHYTNKTVCEVLEDEFDYTICYEIDDPMEYFRKTWKLIDYWLQPVRDVSVDSEGYSVSHADNNIEAKTITLILLPWYKSSLNNSNNWFERDQDDLDKNVRFGLYHSDGWGKFTKEGPIILLFCGEIDRFNENFNGYKNNNWSGTGTISFDINRFTARILSHELCHTFGILGPDPAKTCHDDSDDEEPYSCCCVMNPIFLNYITEATSFTFASHYVSYGVEHYGQKPALCPCDSCKQRAMDIESFHSIDFFMEKLIY